MEKQPVLSTSLSPASAWGPALCFGSLPCRGRRSGWESVTLPLEKVGVTRAVMPEGDFQAPKGRKG